MLNNVFYHGLLRKYSAVFGTLFNEIYINRWDSNNTEVQSIKVPLTYAPKDKMLARLKADPSLNQPVAITLPRMSFEIINISYDQSRKLSTTHKLPAPIDGNKTSMKYTYREVPYNLDFQLYVLVKNITDGNQIVEQILPYFTPSWTVTVNLIEELAIKRDIPIIFQGITMDDQYEGNFEERRALIYTLNFSMKGFFYGPIREVGVIKVANTNFYDATIFGDIDDAVGNSTWLETITVQPAMYANGSPTTNAAASVPVSQIGPEDNYGIAVNITDNTQP
jgi:hypothetical protein